MSSDPVAVEISPDWRSSSCHPADRQLQRLARSQSDTSPLTTVTPGHAPTAAAAPGGTPARVNPFSTRRDLNGGRCKLLDTPSVSVISLTFSLPAPPLRPSLLSARAAPHPTGVGRRRSAPPRRCLSLPCNPDLAGLAAGGGRWNHKDVWKEGTDVPPGAPPPQAGLIDGPPPGEALAGGGRQRGSGLTAEEEEDSALHVDTLSLERLEEDQEDQEEEAEGLSEAMDCSRSPEAEGGAPAASRPLLTSSSYCPLQANGWPRPLSHGPPPLPPLPRVDNNNGPARMTGRQIRWGGAGAGWWPSGYTRAPPADQEPGALCPSCCLVGLALPSTRPWTASLLPHRRHRPPPAAPHHNLNGALLASSAPGTLQGRGANGLGAMVGAPRGRGLSLPEAQT